MRKTKIYLVSNIENNPFKIYIGKTINSRKHNHTKTYGKQIKYNIIDEIDSFNHKDWKPLEIFWIEQFRQWGFEIMNNNQGGGGPDKWNKRLLNSKMNKLRREKIKNHPTRAEKISRATKGIPLTEERKKKLRGPRPHLVGLKKKKWSKESKEKLSQSLKGRDANWMRGKKLTQKHINKLKINNSVPILQYDLNGDFIKEWGSITEASNHYNVKPPYIGNALKKESTSIGFKWKYKK